MSPKEIKTVLKEQPFFGLRFYVAEGESYEVRHPLLEQKRSRERKGRNGHPRSET